MCSKILDGVILITVTITLSYFVELFFKFISTKIKTWKELITLVVILYLPISGVILGTTIMYEEPPNFLVSN